MSLAPLSRKVAQLLKLHAQKLVLAESCTGGLVCGSLTRVPGISQFLCGAMVTYRNETKTQYLGIAERILKHPGPVSEIVARQMAEGVLQRTPEATLAASVTGHLGPQAPAELDGVVYLAVARRAGKRAQTIVRRHVCATHKRLSRQREAIAAVLGLLIETLEG
jgi:PncC family amidohydrolase